MSELDIARPVAIATEADLDRWLDAPDVTEREVPASDKAGIGQADRHLIAMSPSWSSGSSRAGRSGSNRGRQQR